MNNPSYTIRESVLKRWRDQLMTLTPHDNGAVEASFIFEGSSCGNFPFTLVYRVLLGDETSGYPIKEMECHAAPGTVGHERQCSYLNTQGEIMNTANNEKPLFGEPLGNILEWRPETSPAGCLCARASRNHKWLAVLQTLHFALHSAPAKV